jgi:hypothetical protein
MNKSSESYKVYLDKTEAAKSGIIKSQPESRTSLPPVDNDVSEAKEDKGAHKRCADEQIGLNRYPINTHEEEKKTHGPNN